MPTEYRFDDLDLREQPARGDSHPSDLYSYGQNTCDSVHCTASAACTDNCCSVNCP